MKRNPCCCVIDERPDYCYQMETNMTRGAFRRRLRRTFSESVRKTRKMKTRKNRLLLVSVTLVMFSITRATFAGGLFINEFGTPSMGTAGAGAQAWGDDASTSLHNPGQSSFRYRRAMGENIASAGSKSNFCCGSIKMSHM